MPCESRAVDLDLEIESHRNIEVIWLLRKNLGVTRKALSDLLNGHSGMSPEMALRLEKAGWSTADAWLRQHRPHPSHRLSHSAVLPERHLRGKLGVSPGFCSTLPV
jgi:hypothetical protein